VFYVFIISMKNSFLNGFKFLERFLFSSGDILYPTKPAKILLDMPNSCIKQLLSDGFTMVAIKFLSGRVVALKRCHAY